MAVVECNSCCIQLEMYAISLQIISSPIANCEIQTKNFYKKVNAKARQKKFAHVLKHEPNLKYLYLWGPVQEKYVL